VIARPLRALLVALALGLTACSSGDAANEVSAADTLTRRQKDSIISTMPIPGARGVGRALEASDAAAARARRFDSLAAGN
jgi:hypothetical protein